MMRARRGNHKRAAYALIFFVDLGQTKFKDSFKEPCTSWNLVSWVNRESRETVPFFKLEKGFLAEGIEFMLRPSTRVIQYEAACFTIELLFFKEFGYAHSLDRPTSGMSDEEFEAFLLE